MTAERLPGGAAAMEDLFRGPFACLDDIRLKELYGQERDLGDPADMYGVYPPVSDILTVNGAMNCLKTEQSQCNFLKCFIVEGI